MAASEAERALAALAAAALQPSAGSAAATAAATGVVGGGGGGGEAASAPAAPAGVTFTLADRGEVYSMVVSAESQPCNMAIGYWWFIKTLVLFVVGVGEGRGPGLRTQ